MADTSSRAAALAALANQNQAPKVDAPEPVAPEFAGDPVDAGGTVKCGVLFDKYMVQLTREVDGKTVPGEVVTAVKGQVVKVTAEVADRGESLGGLVRL